MAFCLAELHLWSTKSSLQVKDTDIGTYQYHDKGEPANPLEHHYYNEKLHFCEARGYSWTPRNRRPEKLRDSLKELEELLQTNNCVHSRWRNKHCCQVLLSSGVLVTLTLNGPQLEQVYIDCTLVGRLPANTVADAVLSDRLILLSFVEQSQVAAVYLNQKNQDSPKTGRRTDKLSPSEIKVVCVEVSGQARKLRRRVVINRLQDVALCWWDLDEHGEVLWPWTPTNMQRNNLVLLSCSPAEGLKVLGSLQTEGNPLDCRFSMLQPYQLLTVEIPAGPQGFREGSWADTGVYECTRGRLHRLSVTRIPLPSHPVSCSRHPSETTLLLGLSDSSLVLYDQRRGVSLLASFPVSPTLLAWHPAGAVVMVGGEQGELMCFDVGLAPVSVALVAEEVASAATLRLAQHMRCCGGLEGLQWATGLEGDVLMLAFHGGPLAALRFRLGALTRGQMGPGELLQQRLRCGQVREALGILEAMDWSIMGDECYRGLSSVTNHLLRLELNAEREAQLEATLGVFYAPPAPLSDVVILEYREPISKCARRFFHHLLRHQRLEKAFLLAIDLEARDLFMDLHYVASDKGEVVLADVAKRKANEIEAQTIAGNEDPLRGRNGALFGSSLEGRLTERNQSATGPLYPDTLTMHADGRANQRRPQAASIPVTVSPNVFRTLRQTGLRAREIAMSDNSLHSLKPRKGDMSNLLSEHEAVKVTETAGMTMKTSGRFMWSIWEWFERTN
ncbi:WD repeat-containing and planar cell polarity effector protein fritz homolog isoform X1 [Sander lucioperca]|uniref:WD repeat-containing and planar cell polarity effector protein fritz homolog isoform X1 n=1 Tax=Sander lucioperca TaxID=283035 RepID=UPI00125E3F6F|nr:WD repeat-containing and planar cell polarity effector protein fritz homolog isoform X1 [Sander lucioperca]XP_031171859.1 WD repeat-containing and planar cell polarity effector protein fritz homolog isoform X1 [Sander lucioperca]XP_035848096.1 WD repeat-containing and planar cell polarity effector protein fritz homolog isoform X1 [Sander lucioperca]